MKHGIQGPGCETDFFVCFLYQMTKRISLKFYKPEKKKGYQFFKKFLVFSGHIIASEYKTYSHNSSTNRRSFEKII